MWLREGQYLTDNLTQIPLKFRTKEEAEKMLERILKTIQIFKDAEEAIEHDFWQLAIQSYAYGYKGKIPIHRRVCKNPNNIFAGKHSTFGMSHDLNYKKSKWPLNMCLLDGYCPKKWEFDFIKEPTVFIKVPDIKLTNDEYSERIIQYTDYWQHVNGYY